MSSSTPDFHIHKLVIIGVGLIGGSLALALREKSTVDEIIGVGRSVENLQRAIDLNVIDAFTQDASVAVKEADVVIIAVPVGAFESVLKQILPHISKNTVISDVGSVKGEVVEIARRVMGKQIDQFVPAHPIAGSENSGVEAAFPSLFVDHNIIITPLAETRQDLLLLIESVWLSTGAKVLALDDQLHDQVLGVTSHLPHVIVYALMDYLAQQPEQTLHYQFAAGGLFDLTRIASSDAVMWRDICVSNQDKLSAIVREYANSLNQLADQIEAGEGAQLEQLFRHAKTERGQLADMRAAKKASTST
ncbi:MAG: prephenate dehydrogenase/arogenate dehydrogenase family protein [Arenicellales bacterium]